MAKKKQAQDFSRTEQTMVRLTPPVRQELETIAARECRSVSSVIGEVLTNWLVGRDMGAAP